MKRSNLKDSPECFEETIALIERAFEYTEHYSFKIDFYPLIVKSNHENCHILTDQGNVIAHIGVKKSLIEVSGTGFPLIMIGGISIAESYRGKGIFTTFFNEVLALYKDFAFSILWSDKVLLYQKYNFFPCLETFEYKEGKRENDAIKPQLYKDLNLSEKEAVKSLYSYKKENRLQRTESDWTSIESITSSQLYLIKNSEDKIVNYFFKNKGQDLDQIIHEYGSIDIDDLKIMNQHGTVWSPQRFTELAPAVLNGVLLKVQDIEIFKKFIMKLSGLKVTSIKNGVVNFSRDKDTYEFEIADFLSGVLGPNRFEELEENPLLISGLDSI